MQKTVARREYQFSALVEAMAPRFRHPRFDPYWLVVGSIEENRYR